MLSSATVSVLLCLCVNWVFLILLLLLVAQTEAQATTAPNEVEIHVMERPLTTPLRLMPMVTTHLSNVIVLTTKTFFATLSRCKRVYALEVAGVIPEELWSLNFLIKLDVGKNLLSGPLSPSVRNLREIKYLDLGINLLSEQLPKELGMLSELVSLSIGRNNFSGPVPPELGNLSKLEHLYMGTNSFSGPLPSELGHLMKLKTLNIDSSGISGEIPSSFANLRNLETVWAFDIELTGRIPDFIGNWSNLTTLRFQGNSFEGPIPSSFSNLTSLKELELRNNKISGSIPSDINRYWSLQYLDLSFNNISGQIPRSLFQSFMLTHLFLGNNRLTGTLPTYKSGKLLNIDVSFNNLSGSIPSWINRQKLQLNLVANNFTLESNNSFLPYGLKCLQRSFPCNRGSPIYSSFAIKCGGPQITSNNILYEMDDEILGPATYYVTETNRWGISNVGYFTGTDNPQFTISSQFQFTNTLDSELFQTARIATSSLRYYGLGLENGNYTMTLKFAEIADLDTTGRRSFGRRVFDIYIQGNRVEKDFDIKRVAGGVPRRAVQREYTAKISENYLEIHFFWAGKGTCCIPTDGTYGPLISAISATPDFKPTVRPPSGPSPTTKKNLIVGIIVGVGVVSLLLLAVFFIVQRRRQQTNDDGKSIDLCYH
ncbi:hypothetical protein Patl1_24232 [Pistacia atlantica]|uniref:Uncharacterized protein n=1 Tax=Pistacia atlantica TaxID=434234 RepID=A0ACC1A2Z0_9ROSI|nr:hypothetical protein Patl1_24232 [Pistacia atlantica]